MWYKLSERDKILATLKELKKSQTHLREYVRGDLPSALYEDWAKHFRAMLDVIYPLVVQNIPYRRRVEKDINGNAMDLVFSMDSAIFGIDLKLNRLFDKQIGSIPDGLLPVQELECKLLLIEIENMLNLAYEILDSLEKTDLYVIERSSFIQKACAIVEDLLPDLPKSIVDADRDLLIQTQTVLDLIGKVVDSIYEMAVDEVPHWNIEFDFVEVDYNNIRWGLSDTFFRRRDGDGTDSLSYLIYDMREGEGYSISLRRVLSDMKRTRVFIDTVQSYIGEVLNEDSPVIVTRS